MYMAKYRKKIITAKTLMVYAIMNNHECTLSLLATFYSQEATESRNMIRQIRIILG